MTTDIEHELASAMRQEVADVTLTSDVIAGAARSHQRRTVLVRTGYATAVVGLVAGIFAVGGVGRVGPPAADPASPRLELAAAVAASENLSYRMRLKSESQFTYNGVKNNPDIMVTFEGALDPKTNTGYVLSGEPGPEVDHELLVDGTLYELVHTEGTGQPGTGTYIQMPGESDWLKNAAVSHNGILRAAASGPKTLLKMLEDNNATITRNPDGSLHFEYSWRLPSDDGWGDESGDITLAGGRIATVTVAYTANYTTKGPLQTVTGYEKIELFDYGTEVKVERPAHIIPAK